MSADAPDSREDMVEAMKPVAARIPAAVADRSQEGFAALLREAVCPDGHSYERLAALILLLAEACDPGRLEAVTGCRVPLSAGQAHERFMLLSRNGATIPAPVRAGELRWRRGEAARRVGHVA